MADTPATDVSPIMDQVRAAMEALNNQLIPNGYYLYFNPNYIFSGVIATTYAVDEVAGLVPTPPPDGSQATLVKLG